jgi:uncharacterized protein (DUF2252 family)
MDIKEAIAPAAPRNATAEMPKENGARVVAGARHRSSFLGGRMSPARLMRKSVFIRELLPQDLKLDIDRFTSDEAMGVAEFLAHIVGRAHARQLSATNRALWHLELQRNRSKTFEAPSWLWDAVVDLVGVHESAYLQHCRRYAVDMG